MAASILKPDSSDALLLSEDAINVRRLVAAYCSDERNPKLRPFVVHGMFTLDTVRKSSPANLPGCYVIYGVDQTLRYVGMSLSRVGSRIALHFSPATQQSPFWREGSPAHYIDVIEVFRPWEALSLEGYLIEATRRWASRPHALAKAQ